MKIDEILEGIAIKDEEWSDVFDVVNIIGRGNYGVVVKAKLIATGEDVAIKQTLLEDSIDVESGAREIRILQSCHHPNIISYYGTYRSSSSLLVAMELCDGGSIDGVRKFLKQKFTEPIIAYIIHETLCGLQYLHKEKKIHRDIKSGNILMNSEGEVKLADFGITAQLLHTLSRRNSYWGTMLYMAPEVLLESDYDEKADIWSLGITVLEIAEGTLPFAHLGHYPLLTRLTKKPPPTFQHPERFSQEFQSFVHRSLVADKYVRPTATALLEDPFLCGRDYPSLKKEFSCIVQQMIERREALGGYDYDGIEDEEEDEAKGTFVVQGEARQHHAISSSSRPSSLQKLDGEGEVKGGKENSDEKVQHAKGFTEFSHEFSNTSENGKKDRHGENDDHKEEALEFSCEIPLLSTEEWSLDALQFASDQRHALPEHHLIPFLTRQPLSSSSSRLDHPSFSSSCSSSSSLSSVTSSFSSVSRSSSDFRSHSAVFFSASPSSSPLPSSSSSITTSSHHSSPSLLWKSKHNQKGRKNYRGRRVDSTNQNSPSASEGHHHHGKSAYSVDEKLRKITVRGFKHTAPQHLLHSTKMFQHLYAYYCQLSSMRCIEKQEVPSAVETRSKLEDALGIVYHICPTVKS